MTSGRAIESPLLSAAMRPPSATDSARPPPPVRDKSDTSAAGDVAPSPAAGRWRGRYLAALNWSFAAFNSVRILTYLPNIWAIVQTGESGQHSLLTWLSWVGANATMALWLYESNARRMNKAIALNLGNALMCAATCVVIAAYR